MVTSLTMVLICSSPLDSEMTDPVPYHTHGSFLWVLVSSHRSVCFSSSLSPFHSRHCCIIVTILHNGKSPPKHLLSKHLIHSSSTELCFFLNHCFKKLSSFLFLFLSSNLLKADFQHRKVNKWKICCHLAKVRHRFSDNLTVILSNSLLLSNGSL